MHQAKTGNNQTQTRVNAHKNLLTENKECYLGQVTIKGTITLWEGASWGCYPH